MKKNMGTPDRLLRLAIAVVLLILAYWKMSWVLLLAGLFVVFESVFSWCLFYQIIGRNSCPRK